MRSSRRVILTAVFTLALVAAPPWRTSGAMAFDPREEALVIADSDRSELTWASVNSGALQRSLPLPGPPSQLVIGPSGAIYVSLRQAGQIQRIDPSGKVSTLELDGEPHGLALADDERRLFVTLATAGAVVALEARTLDLVWRTPVLPEPRPIALASDGRLYVGHVKSGALSVVDAASGARLRDLQLPAQRPQRFVLGMRGMIGTGGLFEAHRVARQAWALLLDQPPYEPHERLTVLYRTVATGTTGVSGNEGYGGWQARHLLVVAEIALDAAGGDRLSKFQPLSNQASNGPTVATRRKNGWLLISAPGSEGLFQWPNDASLQSGIAGGATAVVSDSRGETVYALSGERRLFWIRNRAAQKLGALAPSPLPEDLQRGRRLYYAGDGRISRDGVACASCHPEGREDGLVWGLNGFHRQTPALAGRLDGTGPYNWNGTMPDLAKNIRLTITRLGGAGISKRASSDLAKFLIAGLSRPTPPALVDPGLVDAGRRVFSRDDVGCADCHVPEAGFTDGQRHHVTELLGRELAALGDGSRVSRGKQREAVELDTPSLRDLRLTAPYFHDGRAPTLEAALAMTDGQMGHTRQLSPGDRAALLAYLQAL